MIDYPACPACESTGYVLTDAGWRPCAACTNARKRAEQAARTAEADPEVDMVDGIPAIDDDGNTDCDTFGDFEDLD